MDPRLDQRKATEHLDLQERRKSTYVQVSQPGKGWIVTAWVAALVIVMAVGTLALYGIRFEYFVIANGSYILRMNRFTGKVCYIPADPEWERVLEGRQALLDRCGL